MKKRSKILIAASFLAISSYTTAQTWQKNIEHKNPTFQEIQTAFNDYWQPFDVQNNGRYILNGKEHKAYGWKQFKRWEWYWKQRTGPSGQFPKNTIVMEEFEQQQLANNQKKGILNNKANNWAPLGPYDETVTGLGRINCMAFHRNNPNQLWVGTPAGGIWYSSNGGSSWASISSNLPVLGVSSIVATTVPQGPIAIDALYVATGDGEGAFSLSTFGAPLTGDTKSVGIFKSTNNGANWTNVFSAQQSNGLLIRKLTEASNTFYLIAVTNQGIYRALTNNINNWTLVQAGDFMDIERHPTNTQILYASTFDSGGNSQVYVSTNAGGSWSQTSSFSGISRINIEVTPANNTAVDLLCTNAADESLYGMYYSVNEGNTWTQYFDGTQPGQNMLGWMDDATDAGGQGTYDLAYAIDPNNWNTILLGGVNTFKTLDGGGTWSPSNVWTSSSPYNTSGAPVVHADKHFLAYHPLVANTVFECNDGGINKSTDGGTTWTNITNGMQISQLYSISSAQTNPNLISGGRQDNGSLIMDGVNEDELSGGDGMMTIIDYSDDNYVYTSYVNGEIYRNIATPASQVTISNNIPGSPSGSWLTPFAIHPTTPTTLFTGYDEVYKTTNRGNSWSQLSSFNYGVPMNYLAVAESNPNYIYAAWYNNIEVSSNGGTSWTNITGSLPVNNNYISNIKIDPTDEDVVIVTFSGYTANEKVFITSNGGTTWQNYTATGLPNLPVNCVEIDATTGYVYVGTDLGVYIYNTISNSWSLFGTGLPNVVVTDLDIQVSANKLRVGTFGRGIWQVDLLSITTDINEVENNNNISVYPNPNNGTFNIEIKDISTLKQVKIIDALGKEVYENSSKSNRYAINNISKGVYFIVITLEKNVTYKKIIVE